MAIASALTPWEIGAYRNDVRGFDVKTRSVYLELLFQLRLRGTLPFDERFLARVGEVGLAFWRNKAWPALCELFNVRDGRLSHPEVERAAPTAPRETAADLSEARRAAGRAGGLQRVLNLSNGQANGQAKSQANGQANPSKNVANSMPVASDFASNLPEAEPSARDKTNSLASSLSSYQPTDRKEESKEDAQLVSSSARADASESGQANLQANRQANLQANPQANLQANPQANPRGRRGRKPAIHWGSRIEPDWQPAEGSRREAELLGHDPDELRKAFVDLWLSRVGNDGLCADFNAAFRGFCRRQRPAQHGLIMAVKGGKTEDKGAFLDRKIIEARMVQAARPGGEPDGEDGPIIEGVA